MNENTQPTETTLLLAEKRLRTSVGFQTHSASVQCDDIVLTGGQEHSIYQEPDTILLVLPYIGDVQVDRKVLIEEHQAYVTRQPGMHRLTNPYETDAINFFIIVWKTLQPAIEPQVINASLEDSINTFVELLPGVCLGQWDGRQEGTYKVKDYANKTFVFAIDGAFEVQNRLMQPRDGLQLQYVSELEFEALSDQAILLIMETH